MSVKDNNTYLTELKVGDKVVEKYIYNYDLRYVSEVKAIDNNFITVSRNGKLIKYYTRSGKIAYPYNTVIPDYELVPYYDASAPTPFKPGEVSSDAESLIPDYGTK